MFFVDTHCHLNFDAFQDNLQQVVDRALKVGVNKIVVVGIDLETSQKAVELASEYDCIYAAVGIHPNEAGNYESRQLESLENLIKHPKVVAVGEIGLDFYHHPETRLVQLELLKSMLSLAKENHKPVLLHSRNSMQTLIELIQEWIVHQKPFSGQLLGVFHGFEGNAAQGFKAEAMHIAVGIGGPITFKNANEKQKMVTELGMQNLVLETDSPLLSPHPFRGQPNEPARISVIAQKIADLLNVPIEEVARISTMNANLLFGWDTTL